MATALRGLSGSRGGARRQTTPPPQLRPLDRVPSTHLVEGKRRIPTCCASGAPDPHTPHAVGRRPSLAALLAAAAAASVGGGSALPATASYVEQDVAQAVYEARKRSVVSLADLAITGDNEVLEGVGSGVVWDALGHIITNYHCVSKLANDRSGAQVTRVELLMPDEGTKTYDAVLVGFDRSQDLAVLKISAAPDELVPMSIGTSGDLRVGQFVFAIGNPFGLSHTLTHGIVSGLSRNIPSPSGDRIYGVIQTDASISSGNSGGPLIDSSGRMVGMNTATFTRQGSGRSSGVNFAVPVDTLMRLVPQIIVKSKAA